MKWTRQCIWSCIKMRRQIHLWWRSSPVGEVWAVMLGVWWHWAPSTLCVLAAHSPAFTPPPYNSPWNCHTPTDTWPADIADTASYSWSRWPSWTTSLAHWHYFSIEIFVLLLQTSGLTERAHVCICCQAVKRDVFTGGAISCSELLWKLRNIFILWTMYCQVAQLMWWYIIC